MKLRTVLLAASMGFVPAVASAQPVQGLYIGALGGYNMVDESDLSFGPTARPGASVEFDGGWAAIGRIGWGIPLDQMLGLRLELEGNYRSNDVDSARVNGITSGSGGSSTTYGAMVNALLDFNLGWVTPYIGAGAGYAWTAFDAKSNGVTIADDTVGNFAYQGIVGANFPISAVPGLMITGEARYFATLDNEYDTSNAFRTANPGSNTVDVANQNWTFLIGLTYAFGVAPPPPPAPAPAAAPAPARTYLVFFDFARADLTDRARQIIAEAAANAPRVQTTRIEVTGHTDTVGSAAYNQALSVRRAEAVAAELERRGIPRSQMAITGRGFSQLLVPTGANVREPQNRRVEIVLR
ncbi:OmpA family protein [Elioraea sp.]|uniref:OmpA family protein n=1 Tax=Elioraea sp. TaxID=2185103 RepID=UPI0025BD652C|nr:OmpA family protein [Elioraea sp.]